MNLKTLQQADNGNKFHLAYWIRDRKTDPNKNPDKWRHCSSNSQSISRTNGLWYDLFIQVQLSIYHTSIALLSFKTTSQNLTPKKNT